MEWLDHSQKKHCELCKTPFQFTNLYDPAMPKRLPVTQMMRRIAADLRTATTLALRWLLVAFVWLAWLPFCTRHIWRSTIRVGDQLTSTGSTNFLELANISAPEPVPPHLVAEQLQSGNLTSGNATTSTFDTFLPFRLDELTTSEAINKILTEIFEGQIIASTIIVVFVVVFLIREWIIQNNANLLDEAPDFADRRPLPIEELMHEDHMELEAEPIDTSGDVRQADPNPRAQGSMLVDAPSTTTDTADLVSGPEISNNDAAEPRTLVPRQALAESSDWDSLKAQAVHNRRHARRESFSSSPTSSLQVDAESSRASSSVDSLSVLSDTENREEESLTTSSERRALRLQATIRAATRRVEESEDRAQQAALLSEMTNANSSTSSTDHRGRATAGLASYLAAQMGDSSVDRARHRLARRRSTDRKLWEDSVDNTELEYPDSPLPIPRNEFELENTVDLRLSDLSLPASLIRCLSAGQSEATYEHERSSDDSAAAATHAEHQPQPAMILTSEQLEVILENVRQARNPAARLAIAEEAIQICEGIARVQGDVPEWSANTVEQLQTIVRVAEERLYVDQNRSGEEVLTQNRDEQQRLRNAQTVDDVPAVNEAAGVNQDEMRGLQAAVVNVNHDAHIPREDLDDDIEGILEVIGVRGPISALLQSSMIVVVMVTAFVVFGICVPHIFGKALLIVASNPRACLVQMPFQISRSLLLEIARAIKMLARGAKFTTSPIVNRSSSLTQITLSSQRNMVKGISFVAEMKDILGSLNLPRQTENVSIMLRHNVQLLSSASASWIGLDAISRSGATFPSRMVSVVCGYCTLTTLGAIYLKANRRLTTGEQGRHIELIVRSVLRQIGFVMKFVVILSIELAVFPFYCGLLLDVVFLPAFHQITMVDRLTFFAKFPFTSLFLHWLVGTIYMFNFALFVQMCRQIVRPGVLFFIRDPNDPGFNPIKDILERPVRNQMKKIGISVLIYGALTLIAFGSVVRMVAYGVQGLAPVRWDVSEPVFEVPFDLLISQILLPLTFRYVQPHKRIKAVWTQWFISTSKLLRLTNFIMGDKALDEEISKPWYTSLSGNLFKPDSSETQGWQHTGSYRRVPATDSVPLRTGKDMIMVVTKDNELVNPSEQDETKDDPDYVVVYVPDHFKLRIYIFLVLMWAFAAAFTVTCTIIPLVFGRRISSVMSSRVKSHDLFSFFYGVYALGLAVWALSILSKINITQWSSTALKKRLSESPEQIKAALGKTSSLVLKWIYLFSAVFIIIPTLLGLCLESYVVIPLGVWLSPDYTLTVHLVHDWIVGLVYVKIIGRTAIMLPTSRLGHALNSSVRNDWRNNWWQPDTRIATRKVILPVVGILIAALIGPLSVGSLARNTIYRNAPEEVADLIYRMSFPAAFLSAALILALKGVHILATRWKEKIRDSLYLKGRQLHNFGETAPTGEVSSQSQALSSGQGTSLDEAALDTSSTMVPDDTSERPATPSLEAAVVEQDDFTTELTIAATN